MLSVPESGLSAIASIEAILSKIITGSKPDNSVVAELTLQVRAYVAAGFSPETLPLDKANVPHPSNQHFKWIIPLVRTSRRREGDKLFDCPFCRRKDKFYDGWVVLCDDIRLRLIGHDCREAHLDAEVLKVGFDEYHRNTWDDFYRSAAPAAIKAAKALLTAVDRYAMAFWSHADSWRILRLRLERDWRDAYAEILKSAQTDNVLYVERWTINYEKLNRLSTEEDETTSQTLPRKLILEPVTRLRGTHWLRSSVGPWDQIKSARQRLHQIANILDEYGRAPRGDVLFLRKVRQFARACEDSVRELSSAYQTMSDMITFFSPKNLSNLGRWLSHPENRIGADMAYGVVANGFEWLDRELTEHRVTLPNGFKVPSFRELQELEDAIYRLRSGILNHVH